MAELSRIDKAKTLLQGAENHPLKVQRVMVLASIAHSLIALAEQGAKRA